MTLPIRTPHDAAVELTRMYLDWCKRKGYTGEIAPDETRAIRRCQLIDSLGYPATPAMIEKELKHTRRANSRKQSAAAVTEVV